MTAWGFKGAQSPHSGMERCVWVRRTNSPIAGPGKARVLGPSTINAPNQPTCSARYAPSAEPALPSCCPLATPRPCSSISTKSQRKSPPAHTPFSFSIKLDGTAPKTSRLPLLPLPPRAPELNPQEHIWQFMRANWLSNRIFKSFDEIVDHCCYAWNTLTDQPWKIMSIARRDWAVAGHSL